jgi:selenide,water dikinase
VKERSAFEGSAHSARKEFLSDPQTSGGLLISVEGSKANALVAELIRRDAAAAAVIGEVRERGAFALIYQG